MTSPPARSTALVPVSAPLLPETDELSHSCILITASFVLGAQRGKHVVEVLTKCLCYLSLETCIFCISFGVRLEIHEPRVTRCVGRDEKEVCSCSYYAHSLTVYGRVLVKLDTSRLWEGVPGLYKAELLTVNLVNSDQA